MNYAALHDANTAVLERDVDWHHIHRHLTHVHTGQPATGVGARGGVHERPTITSVSLPAHQRAKVKRTGDGHWVAILTHESGAVDLIDGPNWRNVFERADHFQRNARQTDQLW